MGKPMHQKDACLYNVGYVEREPCEVKHLSSTWKRNQCHRKVTRDSLSSGERKGNNIEIYSFRYYAVTIGIDYLLAQT
jgi:hypothetical protein